MSDIGRLEPHVLDDLESRARRGLAAEGRSTIESRMLLSLLEEVRDHRAPIPAKPVRLEGKRDGETFDPELDFGRLNRQMQAVWCEVRDGHWWTLRQISFRTGMPEASVSARLRDLRKPRFGEQEVQRRRAGNGLWQYRVVRRSVA